MNRRALPWAYAIAILWLNLYLVRQIFAIDFSAQPQSMHGYWLAIAHLADDHWWSPHWWPYWYGGMPFELTYAPLVPWLARHLGLYVVMGLGLALGPLALFWFAWRLTEKPGWSFIAAVVYSLGSPTELLLPDGAFAWAHLADARRLYLHFVWDEAPHYLALSLLLLGWRWWAIALAALASAFGVTGAAILGLCWTIVSGQWKKVAIAGVLSYLIVCPFYPPSLFRILSANAALYQESAWSTQSWWGLAAVAALISILALATRGLPNYYRFFLILAAVFAVIPWLEVRWGIHFLQQPLRYKIELEFALVLLAVFSVAFLVDRAPVWLRIALALAVLWPAGQQVVHLRRFSKDVVHGSNPGTTIEYRAARWMQQNIPGKIVFAAGSIAQWMNAFSGVHQYTGGSYPTAPSTMQQTLMNNVFAETNPDRAVAMLQQVGVEALVVSGKASPEFWKPYAKPTQFADRLTVLWEEQDTRIYAVPRGPTVPVTWQDDNHAFAAVPGTAPINWHPGWRAFNANGQPSPLTKDPQGQIVTAEPVLLVYDGGTEAKLCRLISALTLLGCLAWPFRRHQRLPVDH